jgi:hypothetical protein
MALAIAIRLGERRPPDRHRCAPRRSLPRWCLAIPYRRDPRWADANTDDNGWGTIDLTAVPGSHDGDVGLPDYVGGWMAHSHPGYRGYACARRAVTVPAGRVAWDIPRADPRRGRLRTLLERPTADWVRLGLNPAPRVVGTRRCSSPFLLMRRIAACRRRAYVRPVQGQRRWRRHAAAPILAPRPISDDSTACNGSEPSPVTSSM